MYLVFQPICRSFIKICGVSNSQYIYIWKSKGLSHERINSITASNYGITTELSYHGNKIRVEFNGSCLKQHKITYNHGTIVNIYIVLTLILAVIQHWKIVCLVQLV